MRIRLRNADIESITNNLSWIDEVAKTLGYTVTSGGIVVKLSRGILSKRIEERVISYAVIRHRDRTVVIFRELGKLDPILRIEILNDQRGIVINTKCESSEKSLCSTLEKIWSQFLKEITKHLKTSKPTAEETYRMSMYYATMIDGLAELTLISMYIRYPLIDRRIIKAREVKNLKEFLETMAMLYRAKELLIHIEGRNWRFIVVLHVENKLYTPSFIENSKRALGEEALARLRTRDDGEEVKLTVFALRE